MVKFLIHRPVAVSMAFLAFLLIGIATTTNLPVSLMPDIDIPVISVRVNSADMPARQLENSIVKPIRNILKQVNHVEEKAKFAMVQLPSKKKSIKILKKKNIGRIL